MVYVLAQAAYARLKQARDMLAQTDPVRVLPGLKGVLGPVKAHVEGLLEQSKAKVRAALDEETARLQAIALELGAEHSRTLTGPIREVRTRLDSARTIDATEAAQLHVQQAAHRVERDILKAINDRAEAEKARARKKETIQPGGTGPVVTAPPTPTKPIRSVKVASLPATTYLQTSEEVEDFLSRLRAQLEQALRDGVRVRLE